MSVATISNTSKEDYDQRVDDLADAAIDLIEDGMEEPEAIHQVVDGSSLVIYTSSHDVVHAYSDWEAGELWKQADSFREARRFAAFEKLRSDVAESISASDRYDEIAIRTK